MARRYGFGPGPGHCIAGHTNPPGPHADLRVAEDDKKPSKHNKKWAVLNIIIIYICIRVIARKGEQTYGRNADRNNGHHHP